MDLETLILLAIIAVAIIVIIHLATRHSEPKSMPIPPSHTLPTFLRKDGRVPVTAARRRLEEFVDLPKHFDARSRWPGWITGVMDQGECGSCWAFSTSAIFGDRIRISSNGQDLAPDDYISHYHLAACMKCAGREGVVCTTVCQGHYIDEVMDWIRKNGVYSYNTIKAGSKTPDSYICFKPKVGAKPRSYKARGSYRVNPYSYEELMTGDKDKLLMNEKQIMFEIYKYGPVTATIKVFDPLTRDQIHQNLYLLRDGVYGLNWEKDPASTDGYHALTIIGWGEEPVDGKMVKYWIVRNSWGKVWAEKGYGKILRGVNRAIIESDIWAMEY